MPLKIGKYRFFVSTGKHVTFDGVFDLWRPISLWFSVADIPSVYIWVVVGEEGVRSQGGESRPQAENQKPGTFQLYPRLLA